MRTILTTALIVGFFATAHAEENLKADAEAINKACTQEAATAGCGAEKVGSGLLKCLHGYKKSHHDFKFSDSCKDAMKQFRHDRKAEKK